MIHTASRSEDTLVCSTEFEAADLRIAGTSTTVARIIAEHATMKDDIAALKQFVGMMSLPPAVPPRPPYWSTFDPTTFNPSSALYQTAAASKAGVGVVYGDLSLLLVQLM